MQIVAYLRSLPATAIDASVSGDAARGRAIVRTSSDCMTCHRIGTTGSALGPDLSRVGLDRRAAELMRALVDPNAEVQPNQRSFQVTPKRGDAVTGRLLNHDTFTVQLFDQEGQLRSFDKADLRELRLRRVADAVVPRHAVAASARRRRQLSRFVAWRFGAMRASSVLPRLRVGARRVARRAGAGHVRPHRQRRTRAAQLAELLGDARQPALQPARLDQHRQRRESRAAVGLAGALAREVRGHAARRRRHSLHRASAERRRGARCGYRANVLDAITTSRRRRRAPAAGA